MDTGGSDLNDPHSIGNDDVLVDDEKHNAGLLKQAIINKDVMLSGVNNGSPASSSLLLNRVTQESIKLLQTHVTSAKSSENDVSLSKPQRLLAPKQHQPLLNNSQISIESLQNRLPSLSQVIIGNQSNQGSSISALNQNLLNTVSLLANQGILSGSSNELRLNESNILSSPSKQIITLPMKNVPGTATSNGTPVQHILIPMSNAGVNQFFSIPLSATAGLENQIQMQNILAKSGGKLLPKTLLKSSNSVVTTLDAKPAEAATSLGNCSIEAILAGLLNPISNQAKLDHKEAVASSNSDGSQVLIVGAPLNVLLPQATNTAIQNLALQQIVQQQQLVQQQLQQLVQQQLTAALVGTVPSGSASAAVSNSIQLQPASAHASQPPIVVIGATQQQLLQQILGGNKPAPAASVPQQQQQPVAQQQQSLTQQQLIAAIQAATRPQATATATNQQLPVAVTEPRFQLSGSGGTVNYVNGITVSQPIRLNIGSGVPILQGQHSSPATISISATSTNLADSLINSSISQLLPNGSTSTSILTDSVTTGGTIVDGVNLDEMREFAKQFKLRRLSLGLTQTQVGQALSVTEGPSYSQSAICRFEKLDITPKSAQKIKPVLERWMSMAEERYKHGVQNLSELIGLEPSKKRKRRTSFTPQALEVLSEHFEHCTHPSGAEMTELADKLDFDREVIRVWFCNKRQTLKNTVKRLRSTPVSSMSAVSLNS